MLRKILIHCLRVSLVSMVAVSCCGPHDGELSGVPPLATTTAMRLSPENPYTGGEKKDEDSDIIRAQSGRYFMTWMSNRNGGNDDVHIIYSDNGASWSPPIRVTEHAESDWYPKLLQDAKGKFHLVWMRQETTLPYARHIYYSSSADGITWNPSNEVALTTGVTDDFLPYIAEHNGSLFIYFGSRARSANQTEDIFYMQSTNGGTNWSSPAVAVGLNVDNQMDTFPYVIKDPDSNGLLMTWVRYDGSFPSPVLPYLPDYNSPTSDIFYATSLDGTHGRRLYKSHPVPLMEPPIRLDPSTLHTGKKS